MATAIYRSVGDWIDYVPPTNPVAAGDVLVFGHIIGVASNDIAVGVAGAVRIKNAQYDFVLNVGDTPTVGQVMYWNASLLVATTNAAYATAAIGICTALSPEGDATKVRVLLLPSLETATAYG